MAGTGLETMTEARNIVKQIISLQEQHTFPIYLEIHRCSITQDIFQTLALAEEFKSLNFNIDLSHWYFSCAIDNSSSGS